MRRFDNIYLTGGAFGMVYQLGAMKNMDINKYRLYGCSAGALSCVMLLLGYTSKQIFEMYCSIADTARDRIKHHKFDYASYNLTEYHFRTFANIQADYPNAYEIVSGRVHVGVTHRDGFRWHTNFESNDDLFNTLLCSFHFPGICSYNAMMYGSKCIDGAFGVRSVPKNTLTICPRVSAFDHCLNGNMTIRQCAMPPSPQEILFFYKKGSNDMKRYLKRGVCGTAQPVDEGPVWIWWLARHLQPEDTEHIVSNITGSQRRENPL
jgi:hypothetical protein